MRGGSDAGSEDAAGEDATGPETGPADAGEAGPGIEDAAATDAGPDADSAAPEPVDCRPIDALFYVDVCDTDDDYCGAVYWNGQGCTQTCAAAGLSCATTYENVEDTCALDDTRPSLPCDSGHDSDYCVCRRPE